ncbi:hypothetical protein THAOC_08600, partial [Thalassiosira oceanica]
MARIDDPSIPMHALYSVWLECGSSPQNHGIVVESESTALGTAVTTPHDDFWPRTTSATATSNGAYLPRRASVPSRVIVVCELGRGLFKLDPGRWPISLEHHQPPCIVVFARPRRTAARLSAPTSPRSAGEVAVIRHRAPLTPEIEKAPPQPEVRHTDPNQAQLPPSQGIRRSPRPVRRPSADPVLAQPTICIVTRQLICFLTYYQEGKSVVDNLI